MCFVCVYGDKHLEQNASAPASKTHHLLNYLRFKHLYYRAEASDEHLAPVIFFLGS